MSDEVSAFLKEGFIQLNAIPRGEEYRTEPLYQTAAQQFLWLTPDPVCDDVWRDDQLPAVERRISLENQLFEPAALGIHAAGRSLEGGRHTSIWVNRKTIKDGIQASLDYDLASCANLVGDSTPAAVDAKLLTNLKYLPNYLNLFNNLYYASAGRDNTFVHYLMNETDVAGQLSVLHFDVSPTRKRPSQVEKREIDFTTQVVDSHTGKFVDRLCKFTLTDHTLSEIQLNILADDKIRCHWVSEVARSLAGTPTAAKRQLNQPELSILTEQLKRRLQLNVDGAALWPVFNVLGEDWKHFNEGWFEPISDNEISDPKGSTDRKVAFLRHFLLYAAFCGQQFYIVRLPSNQKLQLCFTVGLQEPLDEASLKQLVEICNGLCNNLEATRRDDTPTQKDEANLKAGLQRILGPKVTAGLRNQLSISHPKKLTDKILGLDRYLEFMAELAEIAIHEGKRLSFDFLVGDGLVASQSLEKISLLPPLPDRDEIGLWNELPEGDELAARCRRQALGSLLLGNYSFLKHPAVIFGDRKGRLLWLAKFLETSKDAEETTKEPGCYVLRVQANGDIQVFCEGTQVLWRHAGIYLVPQLHGHGYIVALKNFLEVTFPMSSQVINFELLAEVVWQLSQDTDAGACFVVGQFSDGQFPLQNHTARLTNVLPFAEGLTLVQRGNEEVLKQLAVQDGATLIDTDTGAVFGRRQLLASGLLEGRDYLNDATETLRAKSPQHWHKLLRWGTRHHSAFAFSRSAQLAIKGQDGAQMVVLIVSQDGDIHVLINGELMNSLVYPSSHVVDDETQKRQRKRVSRAKT